MKILKIVGVLVEWALMVLVLATVIAAAIGFLAAIVSDEPLAAWWLGFRTFYTLALWSSGIGLALVALFGFFEQRFERNHPA